MAEIANPFKVNGPALISFSGGRTSAYMLHEILRAHHGNLPNDIHAVFANTGKEREETLRFVHECGLHWNVAIHWLEYVNGQPRFREVAYASASRNGEPFEALICKKSYVPNAVTRFCTSDLKVRVMRDFARSLGWICWTNVIGLRWDEGFRVLKAIARSESGKDPWRNEMPLSRARVTKRDIKTFWEAQQFDLGLRDYEGNCDLCFLKGRGKLLALMRENPSMADWWIEREEYAGGRFVTEYAYSQIANEADRQAVFPFLDDEEHDVECGLVCAAEAA